MDAFLRTKIPINNELTLKTTTKNIKFKLSYQTDGINKKMYNLFKIRSSPVASTKNISDVERSSTADFYISRKSFGCLPQSYL